MAGTLFGLGLSQQQNAAGDPLAGCLLYIYEENSSTPATTYSDFTLSTVQTFPIVADSAGRLPQIWVDDGSYRARLTTSAGIEIFDEASVTAIGASVTASGGSGGGGTVSVDQTTVFQTGDVLWAPTTSTRTGWVRANGRTIGSGASAATERANADTQSLFELTWTNISNTHAAVSGGRGATATADFNANKTITILDMRGRTAYGFDAMGNTTAGVLTTSTDASAPASPGGAETITLTTANIPSYNLDVSGLSVVVKHSTRSDLLGGGGSAAVTSITTAGAVLPSYGVSGTLASGGAGTAKTSVSPYRLGTWYLKL